MVQEVGHQPMLAKFVERELAPGMGASDDRHRRAYPCDRHHGPSPARHLPDGSGVRSVGGGGFGTARAWHRASACHRCLCDARSCRRQHQRCRSHDRGTRRRPVEVRRRPECASATGLSGARVPEPCCGEIASSDEMSCARMAIRAHDERSDQRTLFPDRFEADRLIRFT